MDADRLNEELQELRAERDRLQAALDRREELEALFDLQQARMHEATERWRAEDPAARELVLPDLGDLLTWLMDRADVASAQRDHYHRVVSATAISTCYGCLYPEYPRCASCAARAALDDVP